MQGEPVGLAYPSALSLASHDLISVGRIESSRRGPNSALILAMCTSAIRTVEDFRLAYALSQVSHHWATVVLAVFGATQLPVSILVVSWSSHLLASRLSRKCFACSLPSGARYRAR
jgi:hypothetical protein